MRETACYHPAMSATSTPSVAQRIRYPRLGRFAYLMGLYAENHARLTRMFDPARLAPGRYVSSVGDRLDVHLEIVERHRYTVEMRITYAITDPQTGEPDPSAHIRFYGDARQAEATHCYIGRRWQDVLGVRPDIQRLVGHRLRMNGFLNKWLEFLAEQGHSQFTLERVEDAFAAEVSSLA